MTDPTAKAPGPFERFLETLGLKNPTGHAIGCRCDRCKKTREDALQNMRVRVSKREPPQTLGEVLAEAQRRRKESEEK